MAPVGLKFSSENACSFLNEAPLSTVRGGVLNSVLSNACMVNN